MFYLSIWTGHLYFYEIRRKLLLQMLARRKVLWPWSKAKRLQIKKKFNTDIHQLKYRTLVWIADMTLVDKNQNKVFQLRLRRARSTIINEICTKWKLNSSPFNRHMFRYTRTSMSREISALKGEENLTGRVSFLQSKLVWNRVKKLLCTLFGAK